MITHNGLCEGDLVTYEGTDTFGRKTGKLRPARIVCVHSPDLVTVRFSDVSTESGGGYDPDSPDAYTKCEDEALWKKLLADSKREQLLSWRAYYCKKGDGCLRNDPDACQSCRNYDADPRLSVE